MFEIPTSLSIEITDKFILTITISKAELEQQSFITKEVLKKYISLSIYDALFFSKFKLPKENIIEFEYIDKEQSNCFDYKFIIKNIDNI